jgi:hypothetical protein
VVVDNLDVESVTSFPAEANAPLLIYSNAVLACSIPRKGFEPVCWWYAKVGEVLCAIEHGKLVEGALLDLSRQSPGSLLIPYFLSFCIAKTLDHQNKIPLFPLDVNNIFTQDGNICLELIHFRPVNQ